MGNSTSNTQKIEAVNEMLTSAITNITSKGVSTARASSYQEVNISLTGISGNVDISNITSDQTANINLTASISSVQDATTQADFTTQLINDVTAKLKNERALYPTNIAGQDDVTQDVSVQNIVSNIIENNINLSQTSECLAYVVQRFNIDISDVKGDVGISNLTINQMANVFADCVMSNETRQDVAATIVNKGSNTVSAESETTDPVSNIIGKLGALGPAIIIAMVLGSAYVASKAVENPATIAVIAIIVGIVLTVGYLSAKNSGSTPGDNDPTNPANDPPPTTFKTIVHRDERGAFVETVDNDGKKTFENIQETTDNKGIKTIVTRAATMSEQSVKKKVYRKDPSESDPDKACKLVDIEVKEPVYAVSSNVLKTVVETPTDDPDIKDVVTTLADGTVKVTKVEQSGSGDNYTLTITETVPVTGGSTATTEGSTAGGTGSTQVSGPNEGVSPGTVEEGTSSGTGAQSSTNGTTTKTTTIKVERTFNTIGLREIRETVTQQVVVDGKDTTMVSNVKTTDRTEMDPNYEPADCASRVPPSEGKPGNGKPENTPGTGNGNGNGNGNATPGTPEQPPAVEGFGRYNYVYLF